MKKLAVLFTVLLIANQVTAAAAPAPGKVSTPTGASPAAGVGPLAVEIDARDALRFAPHEGWRSADGCAIRERS